MGGVSGFPWLPGDVYIVVVKASCGREFHNRKRPLRLAALALAMSVGCAVASPPGATKHSGQTTNSREPQDLPIPPEMAIHVRQSEAIGRQLYVLDKASALGTDALLAKVPNFQERGVTGGYLTLQDGDEHGKSLPSFTVRFFTHDEPPLIAYEVHVKFEGEPELRALEPPAEVKPGLLGLIRARQAAIAALPQVRQPLNPVIIPGDALGEKGVLVYLLAGTNAPHMVVFGQHFRALVPWGANTPTYLKPLSNSVLEVPLRDPEGHTPVALVVSHLVTDWPLETHVFTSLLWHKMIFVKTKTALWRVDGDKIALMRE